MQENPDKTAQAGVEGMLQREIDPAVKGYNFRKFEYYLILPWIPFAAGSAIYASAVGVAVVFAAAFSIASCVVSLGVIRALRARQQKIVREISERTVWVMSQECAKPYGKTVFDGCQWALYDRDGVSTDLFESLSTHIRTNIVGPGLDQNLPKKQNFYTVILHRFNLHSHRPISGRRRNMNLKLDERIRGR